MFHLHQYRKNTHDYVLHIGRCNRSIAGWVIGKNCLVNELIVRYQDDEQKVPLNETRPNIEKMFKNIQVNPYCGFSFIPQKQENLTLCIQISDTVIEIAKISYFNEKKGNRPIIFIHIPKTAGTSFRNAANEKGLKTLYDYGNTNSETSDIIKSSIYKKNNPLLFDYMMSNDIQFLGGHQVFKYLNMFAGIGHFCTFFREPVQRIISEYNHFVRHYHYQHSIEVFCTNPIFCNRQSKLINNMDLESLYFFGLTEDYKTSLSLFNKLTGLDLPYVERNIGREKLDDKWQIDQPIIDLIIANNQEDVVLYKKAKEMFYKNI